MQDEREVAQAKAHGWRLARSMVRPHAPVLLLALTLMLVQSAATLAQPWLGGVLTDRLLLGSGVGPLLWVLFGLILAQQAIGYLVSIQLQAVSGRLVADAGSHVYAHLQSLPLAWHHARQRGDVLALLTGDVYRLGTYVTGTLVPLVPLLFTFVGALIMMLENRGRSRIFRESPRKSTLTPVLLFSTPVFPTIPQAAIGWTKLTHPRRVLFCVRVSGATMQRLPGVV